MNVPLAFHWIDRVAIVGDDALGLKVEVGKGREHLGEEAPDRLAPALLADGHELVDVVGVAERDHRVRITRLGRGDDSQRHLLRRAGTCDTRHGRRLGTS